MGRHCRVLRTYPLTSPRAPRCSRYSSAKRHAVSAGSICCVAALTARRLFVLDPHHFRALRHLTGVCLHPCVVLRATPLVVKDKNMITNSVSPRCETETNLAEDLARLEVARQQQLDALPTTKLDVVAAAHRASVVRILEEVRLARQRLADGSYGLCMSCSLPISVGRLELRPWASMCTTCTERPRW